jgi:hypothetical protein
VTTPTLCPRTLAPLAGALLVLAACGGDAFKTGGAGGAGGNGGASTSGTAVTSTSTCAGADCDAVTATTATTTATTTSTGQGGAGGQGEGGSMGQGGGAPAQKGIAMLLGELYPSGSGSAVSTGSTSGGSAVAVSSSSGGPDPNTLVVFLGDPTPDCGAPGTVLCPDQWTFFFRIPPALQVPGAYTLSELEGFLSETGPGQPNCPSGAGLFYDGTVLITEIDATHVQGTVIAGDLGFMNDPSGDFVAARCF